MSNVNNLAGKPPRRGHYPRIGEVQVYLAHIGMDDYAAVRKNVEAFNLIVRYCGGIPQRYPMQGMCASLVFTERIHREDFAREMRTKLGVTVAIDFSEVFVDRRRLPPQTGTDHTMDRYDFTNLTAASGKAEYEKAVRLALHPEEEEPEYVFPDGKLPV